MKKKINIRPTTGVYATYKNINYQIWTAIAEFVDNSTQSYFDNKKSLEETKYWKNLEIEINYKSDDKGNFYFEIKDNAFGMDFHDFKRAIVLDSKPLKQSRSEFGMGLKTAACWFGGKWSVESTALGNNNKYYTEVDVEQLSKYKNEEIEVEESECSPKDHGTIIKIWNLNKSIKGRSIGKTKDMLSSMYREDLRTGNINIYYNGDALTFSNPDIYIDEDESVWKKDINFILERKGIQHTVRGFIAIRKKASTTSAGFTLLRRGRVIIGGYDNNYRPQEIFATSNSFEWQRLFGELHMDDWPVVQTKDNFDWQNGLEDMFIDKLKDESQEYIKKSKEIRVRKKTDMSQLTKKTVESFEKSGLISDVVISDYQFKNVISDSDETDQRIVDEFDFFSADEKKGIILENYTDKSIDFKINAKSYRFNLSLDRSNPESNWLKIIEKDNEYTITWNINHIFFREYMNNPDFVLTMQKFIFAFAISEISTKKNGENKLVEPNSIRNSMNDILKIIGEVYDESL